MTHQVLLVDDDTPTRLVYREILSRLGLEVSEAQDGLVAINHLTHQAPNLVILDLLLPYKSGMEVLDYIYNRPHLAETHVIIFSAHDRTMVRYLRPGDLFLQKPINPQYIREAVMRILSPASASS